MADGGHAVCHFLCTYVTNPERCATGHDISVNFGHLQKGTSHVKI